ncbi:MAG: VWA domain-containing protein [Burkholderiaceae bacterium]
MRLMWPDALWLLLLLPLLVFAYLYVLSRRKRHAVRFPSLLLVRDAIPGARRWRRHVPPALMLVALAAALIAVARPVASVVLPSQYLTLVLAVDVSRSMLATDIKPSRIVAAQRAAQTMIEGLPGDVRLGIVSFAGTAVVALSPTDQRDEMLATINGFRLQRHTATGSGLLVSLSLLMPQAEIDIESAVFDNTLWRKQRMPQAPSGTPGSPRRAIPKRAPGTYTAGSIILLSDGRRTTGPDPLDVAKIAADLGVRVYTVGFGLRDDASGGGSGNDDDGFWAYYMRLDEETLKAVAKRTGGEYFHASNQTDLSQIYRQLTTRLVLERRRTEITALFGAACALLVLLAIWLSLRWFPTLGPAAPRPADQGAGAH